MKKARPSAAAIAMTLAGATGAYAAACGFVALAMTRPRRVPFERSPDQYGLEFESVGFPSRIDRIPLDGWLLPAPPEAPSRRPIVMVHGMGSDRQQEAGGRALEIAAALVRNGHPVLMFDLRGSGRSGGDRFTLGAQEVRDVGGALDFLAGRGLCPKGVNLLGYSMGAATALLLTAIEPRVRAVAEDSGYAYLNGVLDHQLPKMSRLPRFFTPGVVFAARSLLGVDAYSIRPVEAVAGLGARAVPLLVIHGEADTVVPVDHGRLLATAYGPAVDTLFVPGAEHVVSYAADPAAYLAQLTAFFDRSE